MYRVMGGDGKPYGPVTAEQVRQWIAEGRLVPSSRAQAEGDTDWRLLSSFPELAETAPPPPLGAPVVAARAAKTSGLAIASLVLGVLSIITCGLTAIPGLVLGIVGLVKINRSGGQLSGTGLSIAGICVSGLMLVMLPIYGAMLVPALIQTRGRARQAACRNNLRQVGVALHLYVADHEQLPNSDHWCDALTNYLGKSVNVFQCPAGGESGSPYAFNRQISGPSWQQDPQAVMVVDGAASWNATIDGPEDIQRWPHRNCCNVLFVDGHIEAVSRERLPRLHWTPRDESR